MAATYGKNVVLIREKWSRKGGRFQIKHAKGLDIFEFDSTSESRDQLRNACFRAQQLINEGTCKSVAFQPEGGEPGRATQEPIHDGLIDIPGLDMS